MLVGYSSSQSEEEGQSLPLPVVQPKAKVKLPNPIAALQQRREVEFLKGANFQLSKREYEEDDTSAKRQRVEIAAPAQIMRKIEPDAQPEAEPQAKPAQAKAEAAKAAKAAQTKATQKQRNLSRDVDRRSSKNRGNMGSEWRSETSKGQWKSDQEMVLRQQFDS